MNQPTRQRMTHQARRQQLIGVAWNLVRAQGSDALTLGRVAEAAGVSKPVVYDLLVRAADAISNAVVYGDISQQQGLAELQALILALVERHQ